MLRGAQATMELPHLTYNSVHTIKTYFLRRSLVSFSFKEVSSLQFFQLKLHVGTHHPLPAMHVKYHFHLILLDFIVLIWGTVQIMELLIM